MSDPTLTWEWSFLEISGPSASEQVRAHGQLSTTATTDDNGYHTILSITGERDGVAIRSLLPPGSITPGNCENANTCYQVDNLLRPPDSGNAQLTSNGFAVCLANGSYANNFFSSFWSPPASAEFHSVPPFGYLNFKPPRPPSTELAGVFRATVVSNNHL